MKSERHKKRRVAAKKRSLAVDYLLKRNAECKKLTIEKLLAGQKPEDKEFAKILSVLLAQRKESSPADLKKVLTAEMVRELEKELEELPLSKLPAFEEQSAQRVKKKSEVEKLIKQISRIVKTLEMGGREVDKYDELQMQFRAHLNLFNELRRNKKRLIRYLENLSPEADCTVEKIVAELKLEPIDGKALFSTTLVDVVPTLPLREEQIKRAIRGIKELDWNEFPLQGKKSLITESELEQLRIELKKA